MLGLEACLVPLQTILAHHHGRHDDPSMQWHFGAGVFQTFFWREIYYPAVGHFQISNKRVMYIVDLVAKF